MEDLKQFFSKKLDVKGSAPINSCGSCEFGCLGNCEGTCRTGCKTGCKTTCYGNCKGKVENDVAY